MRKLTEEEIVSVLRNEEEETREKDDLSEKEICAYLTIIRKEMEYQWTLETYKRYWRNYRDVTV